MLRWCYWHFSTIHIPFRLQPPFVSNELGRWKVFSIQAFFSYCHYRKCQNVASILFVVRSSYTNWIKCKQSAHIKFLNHCRNKQQTKVTAKLLVVMVVCVNKNIVTIIVVMSINNHKTNMSSKHMLAISIVVVYSVYLFPACIVVLVVYYRRHILWIDIAFTSEPTNSDTLTFSNCLLKNFGEMSAFFIFIYIQSIISHTICRLQAISILNNMWTVHNLLSDVWTVSIVTSVISIRKKKKKLENIFTF